jgi:hypothetical protein
MGTRPVNLAPQDEHKLQMLASHFLVKQQNRHILDMTDAFFLFCDDGSKDG